MKGTKMAWIDILEKHIKALEQADFPPNSICQHTGVTIEGMRLEAWVGIVICGASLTITMYGKKPRAKMVFDDWREKIESRIGKVMHSWNGEEGCAGVTFVLDRIAPIDFFLAIERYRSIKDVFNLTPKEKEGFEEFNRAWLASIKRQGIGIKSPKKSCKIKFKMKVDALIGEIWDAEMMIAGDTWKVLTDSRIARLEFRAGGENRSAKSSLYKAGDMVQLLNLIERTLAKMKPNSLTTEQSKRHRQAKSKWTRP